MIKAIENINEKETALNVLNMQKLASTIILTTVRDHEPLPTPQSHLWLGLQTAQILGPELEDFQTILHIGKKLNWWTTTSETISLTPSGQDIADELNTYLSNNSSKINI